MNPGVLLPVPVTPGTASALRAGRTSVKSSSGVLVATGTGATGWCRSLWLDRHSKMRLPAPGDQSLVWFVLEAWPSPATGTEHTEGSLEPGDSISLIADSDGLVVFGDGIESDHLTLGWGQQVTIRLAEQAFALAAPPLSR